MLNGERKSTNSCVVFCHTCEAAPQRNLKEEGSIEGGEHCTSKVPVVPPAAPVPRHRDKFFPHLQTCMFYEQTI